MTDFTNPPTFRDPGSACPKCLRSDLFSPHFREGEGSVPDTITWVHGCGYSVVTRTNDDTQAAMKAPIDETEITYDEWRTESHGRVSVQVTHRPTGIKSQATHGSRMVARETALAMLKLELLNRPRNQSQ